MIFTGTQLLAKRNFFTQTGNYGFVMSATVSTTTGAYHFGLSGAGAQSIDFRLESGRMYWNNQFIHAYKSYEPFVIEGQFTSGAANIIKDNTPLIYGVPKATGSYDYFYFSRASADMGGEFDVQISGNNGPVYSITQQGYLTSSGQNVVTGWFLNQSDYPIRVFDSTIQASANYDFGKLAANIGAANSGAFAFSGDYDTIDFSQPILTTFATSFGNAAILFSIIDTRTLDHFIQLTAPTDFSFTATGVLNRNVSWLNYSGGVVVGDYPTSLVFQLRYATGLEAFTGAWNILTGGSPTSLVALSSSTGLFSGSGIFPSNNYINLQIMYSGVSGNSAQLVISGVDMLNPINQMINL